MKTASWVLLALVGALTLLGGLASASFAYRSENDQLGGAKLTELASGRPELATAIRGRRATAAAYAAAYAALLLAVVLGPYRRGDVWAWWAILASTLVLAAISLARAAFLATGLGAGAAGIELAVVAVALLLDAGRLRSPGQH
jgi:hypothetical protein